jgi:hypothetical protein
MNVYPVPDALQHHYKGRGIALGATRNGELVALVYVRDLIPDFADTVEAAPTIGDNARVADVARALEKDFGFVRVGIVSSWEFCEL